MSRDVSDAVHPTVFLAAWAIVGFGLGRLWPIPFLSDDLRSLLVPLLMIPGVVLVAWAVVELWRRDTTSDHGKPTTALVTSGPFRLSRHPIYLGLALLMAGFALEYHSLWSLVLLVPTMAAIQRYTVEREEEYLEDRFGDEYSDYRASVRQWL